MRRSAVAAGVAIAITCAWSAPALANEYTPNGTITAGSGFQPAANGYSFANYGNEGGPQNLTFREVFKVFGSAVCIGGVVNGNCTLTPAARQWMFAWNNAMGGGHCEGFAVTASFFYSGIGEPPAPGAFGADTVPGLALGGNTALQAHIAYGFVFQGLPAVSQNKLKGNAFQVLDALNQAFAAQLPTVIHIFKANGSGGHAVTPIAIETRENGAAILVYDNNYPNRVREITIGSSNRWSYQGSPNPEEAAGLYEGGPDTTNIQLEAPTRGLGVQPCHFCRDSARGAFGSSGGAQLVMSVDPRDGQRSEVAVRGPDGQPLSEVPGVEQVDLALGGTGGEVDPDGEPDGGGGDGGDGDGGDGGDGDGGDGDGDGDGGGPEGDETGVPVWEQSAPPVYNLPADLPIEVEFDAGDLEERGKEGFSLVRDELSFTVDGLELEPGDDQAVDVGRKSLTLPNDSDHGVSPEITYGDLNGGKGFEVTVDASGLAEGSELRLDPNPEKPRLDLGVEGRGDDDVKLEVAVARLDADGGTDRASTRSFRLGDRDDDGTIAYSQKAMRDGELEPK